MKTLTKLHNPKNLQRSVCMTQHGRFLLNVCVISYILGSVASVSAQKCTSSVASGTRDNAYITIVHPNGTRNYYQLPVNPAPSDRGCVLVYAKNQAQSGDTIMVAPGEAEAKNLLKNGVNWYLEDGAVIENTSDNTVGIFDDGSNGANGPVVSSISGHGVVKCTSTTGFAGTVTVVNPGSNIHLQAKEAWNRAFAVILQADGTGHFHIDRIDGTGVGSGSRGVSWTGGETFVEAQEILSSGKAVYSAPEAGSGQGNLFVRAKNILSMTDYAVGSVPLASPSPSPQEERKVWIDAETIGGGPSSNAVHVDANEVHITAQKIDSHSADQPAISNGGGRLWVTAQKVTGLSPYEEFMSNTEAAISHLDVLQWELLGSPSAAVVVNDGTVFASGRVWQTGTGDGFKSTGGKLFVQNANICTQAGSYDLRQSDSGVVTVAGTVYDVTKVSGTIRQGSPHSGVGPSLPLDGNSYQLFRTTDGNIWAWNGALWVRLNN